MRAAMLNGLMVVVLVASSSALALSNEALKLKAAREKIQTKITKLNQDLTCKKDDDCVALSMGKKPCGGAWKFIAASKRNKKFDLLEKTLGDYAKKDEAYNKAAELMSDCSMTMAPTVTCKEKKCQVTAVAKDLKPQ
jgi:hypothetical protein